MRHLWLRGGLFPDWIAGDVHELRACEMYHCLPSQLAGEETYKLERHQMIKAAENEYLAMDAKARRGR